jgi:cobalt transporter subunit CbtA
MQTDFLATEGAMSQFRRLLYVALVSGTLAGLAWFGFQYYTILPLIATAEVYESAAHESTHHSSQPHDHDEGWRPANGWQRNSYTALATVLTSIGYASMLFGLVSLSGRRLDARRGAMWGLAAFVCFGLAPALGLPPQPPGVAVADLADRQLWWAGTVLATATGLYLVVQLSRPWPLKLSGLVCLALPHLIGPPVAIGDTVIPAALTRQFVTSSLVATGLFWLTLGALGGLIYSRNMELRG